jgi:PAS domain-containing protein
MSLNCRIFRDEKGQIDFVNAPNGNRSKLFDNLVNITGGNKNTALNIYALTEVEELKEGMNTKLNALKERFKSIVKVAPADVSFSIIGLKGAQNLDTISGDTTIVDNLEVAIEMEKSNETPLKIKIATGWQRGADNQWKYELDSSKASLNLNIDSMAKLGKKYSLKSVLKYPELFKAYPELNDVKISVSKKGGTTTEGFFDGSQIVLGIESNKLKDFFEAKSRLEKYKNLDPEVLRIVRKNIEIDAYRESLRASGVPFSEAFDMAFEKYPYDERQEDLEILGRLGYAEMTKSSVSNLMFLAEKDNFYQIVKDFKEGSEETLQKSDFNNLNNVLLPVTLHEIQHWIQQKEGFARGASTRSIYSYFTKEQIDEYKSLVEKKKEEEAKLNGKKWYDAPPEIRDIIFAPTSYLYQKYRSAMGEEEARNVEKRLKMTPKERLYSMLQDTEDNPRAEQIFIPQNRTSFNQVESNQKEVLTEVADRLKQSGLANNVYQMSNSEIQNKLEEIGESNVEKTAAGFTYKGDVYLNTDAMGLDTPIHEFGHLHLDWLKENRNDLYKAGLSLIEKNKEEAQQYIDTVKESQPDLKEGTEKFNNEVLAQVIGDQGAKLIQSKEEQSIADWLRSVWESIKDVLGLTSYTADQVSNMTLADFGTASATEMLSGNRISRNMGENNAYLRYKYDVNQVARERFDIPNLKEISSGSDRVVFDLGDNKVLKVANTARGLAQNMQEGDAQLIEKGLIPQVYETGLNYVVVEKVGKINEDTRIPVYDVKGKRYDDESLFTMIKELNEYSQADFDVKDQNLIDILNSYGIGAMADYDIIFGDLLNPLNWGMKDGKLIHLDAGTFGGMYMIRAYARRKDMSFEDFKQVYEKSQEAKSKFGDVEINANINFSIVAGNKLFNEPLEDAAVIANEYMSEKGMSTSPIQKITKLDTDNSKRIAKEFEKMKATPNDPETKAAYKAMVDETLEQYQKIINKGYKVEINNLEPYDSSADMIKDLRENKSMKIFSTESGFGDEPITDKQRKENPLLQETKYKDVNGLPLLANDIFRFVHDFFGHAKFGNGFGAIGEENAWNVHSRMYSPLARRAMTTETRGQNSFVNFSGVNDEAFKKRDKARVLRQQGKLEEAKKLTEQVYEEMSFAEQKIGLLPEWASIPKGENISPENSSNYANLTEDGQGNYVFYHVGNNGYETIKVNSGSTAATSKQEAAALSKVGGLAMYYTRPEDGETMVSGSSKYMVKVPMDKVYDFNTDVLNLYDVAKEQHDKENPGKSFDPNSQLAYITKIAGELGYEMVVSQWKDITRAQSIKELSPVDTQILDGNVISKPFQDSYDSNTTKGYKSVIPVTKDEKLKSLYLEINSERNSQNRYDSLYSLYMDYSKKTESEVADMIKNSDISQGLKNKYNEIANSKDGSRMSIFNPPSTPVSTRQPSLEKDGVKIFAKERTNPITGEKLDGIEWELIESSDRGKGNARKAAELFLNGTDAQGKDVYLTISPRDNETSPEKLESFYSSLGFEKTSDFEMVRRAKGISLKDLDSNGEPSISTLMGFSNSKVKPLGLEGLKAAKNAAMALKVKSSQELIEKMEKALMKNGIVLFDKLSLQRSKLYNTFEINTILSSPKLQKQIKDSILALRNSEPFTIEYDEKFIVPQGREVNQFGKQEVINPNVSENEIMQSVAGLKESEIDEALPAAFTNKYYTDSDFRETVDSIARDYKKAPVKTIVEGELVDKVEDVENMLLNTVTNDENDSMSEDIMFLREEIDEEIFNSNLEKVSKVLNKIKKNAYINGIDLRNLPTLALELSREELLGFLDSMEDVIVDQDSQGDLKEFSERYFEILGDKEAKTEIIKSDSENDIIVEEPLSEYEMFSKFGLVKKDDNIYRQVTEESLDNLYENFFEYKNLLPEGIETVEALKSYVQKNANQLEVSDYEVDVDNLEKMFLYKKFFDFPMSTQKARVKTDNFNKITNSEGYLTDVFMKDFNKWILATANPYFKVTGKGIELINNDELSKVEAINSVPEKFKQELAEYNIISDSLNLDMPLPEEKYEDINTQLEQRQKAVNNPDRVKKVSGQYTYLKDEVLAAKNESETFVRTPIGIFEKIFEFENIKFYGKLDTGKKQGYKKVNIEAPFSDINFKDYSYLANSPESFKTSKNYYSRNELNDINDEYFGCQ